MGLARILIFSALTGISFSLAIGTSGEAAGLGFARIDFFSQYLDSSMQALTAIVSSIFTIFFIFRLAKFFREVYEHRLAGIVTGVLGFSGSFMIILAQQSSHVFVLGVGMWMFAVFIVIFFRNKTN